MAKYLIRGGKTPTEKFKIDNYVNTNLMGSNSGNYMYLYGIIRTLTTDENVTFESTRYRYDFDDAEIDRINNECDGFIIPLADAFRENFMAELVGITKLVNKLKIPSYVIGVGVKAGAEEKLANKSFGFEKKVQSFVKAVLKNSNNIGVRGETTGEFLEYLGFKEGQDFKVIGCPSMYTFGNNLKIRDTQKTADSNVAYNLTYYSKPETIDFMDTATAQFTSPIFVPQMLAELKTLYWGIDYKNAAKNNDKQNYPCNIKSPVYAQDRVRFFVNVNEWIDFMKTRDLVFGTRLHGNIPAVIAGTPSILITKDIRMRELARFHGLTWIDESKLYEFKDIWELIDSMNFHSPESKQRENFENYLDFLHSNGFKTIYDENKDRADAPLDDMIRENDVHNEFKSAALCSKREISKRMNNSIKFVKEQREALKDKNKNLKDENKKLKNEVCELKKMTEEVEFLEKTKAELQESNKRVKYLENILNSRCVRYSLSLRNIFVGKDKKIEL
ncbi:MAG: polysaccharide pyruvyl transferase family protein [Ruminococcus sp.]|nr:polysaccharide pyruvyl transferase family protein [Ruminococcus sp.]